MSILAEIAITYRGVRTVFWRNPVGKIEFSGLSNVLNLWISLPPQLANIQRELVEKFGGQKTRIDTRIGTYHKNCLHWLNRRLEWAELRLSFSLA